MKVKVPGFKGGDHIQLPESENNWSAKKKNSENHSIGVLMNGSALAFNWEAWNVPAILEAWHPGQAGGTLLLISFSAIIILQVDCRFLQKDIDQIPASRITAWKGNLSLFEGKPRIWVRT